MLPPDAADPIELDGTGVALWYLLEEPVALEELVAVLADVYDGDPAQVRGDVAPFLEHLVGLSVLEHA